MAATKAARAAGGRRMDDQDDIIREFLVESHENLDQLDRDLVALEKTPDDRDRLASVFRALHTIKGACGFLSFPRLEAVAHAGEGLLSRLRDGRLVLNADITSALLALVDAVRRILSQIETTRQEGMEDHGSVIARVAQLRDAATPPLPVVAAPESADVVSLESEAALSDEPAARDSQANARTDASIRVDVGLLDRLVNLVGELVLARNQVLQFTGTRRDPAFLQTTQRLNQITTELQEGVLKTRMQPIGNILNKFPRQVRDLAVACGKQVHVTVEGEETELDKTLLEAIKDPLTHLVRNAVDHGVEPPEERIALGKPPEGRLALHAFHEGGQVNINVADDGRGIDPERVRRKAVERGLIPRDQAARLTERELLQLIFLPGFSTAERVTHVSGRGVGMDVVKTNIEKIGGAVDVLSRPGQGTTVKIKIPLTLAIIPALIVGSGGDRYAIPQVSLLELVRLDGDKARRGFEQIHGVPVYRLRGNLLPLVFLHRELRVEPARPQAEMGPVHVAVLQAGERPFGLVVEAVSDTEEIVVKPLSKHFKGLPLFAGATIMGDGRVALILDILGLRSGPASFPRCAAASPSRPPHPRSADGRNRRSSCSNSATAGAWPSRSRWWHGWKSFLPMRSSEPPAGRWCSTGTRSCPWCGWIRCFRAPRTGRRRRIRFKSWSSPPTTGASAWWFAASSTWSRRRRTCSWGRGARASSAWWSCSSASPTCST